MSEAVARRRRLGLLEEARDNENLERKRLRRERSKKNLANGNVDNLKRMLEGCSWKKSCSFGKEIEEANFEENFFDEWKRIS
jgi:hypothetical protein